MFKQLACIGLSLLSVTSGIYNPVATVGASATTYDVAAIESSYVLDDLQGSTIEGKTFDVADYPADKLFSDTKLLSFAEYGYDEETTANYNLFAYVYNPKQAVYDVSSEKSVLNQVTFSLDGSNYEKYSLSYVNSSVDEYEGLFYKFKVLLTEEQKQEIYSSFTGDRVYNVSEIELVTVGLDNINADAYTVGKQYRYSGNVYDGTLTCTTSFVETLGLEVGHTQYRPEGTNGKDNYTQDSLHSVWFAVPKEVTADNGALTGLHARWLDAVLKPQLVTGNEDAIKYTTPLLGRDIGVHTGEAGYAFTQYLDYESYGQGVHSYYTNMAYNMPSRLGTNSDPVYGSRLTELYYIYDSGRGADSADTYVVPSKDIHNNLIASADLYGGNLVNGKYSEKIFSNVAENWSDVTIRADDTFSLTSNILNNDFWSILFGGAPSSYNTVFDGIEAIKLLTEEDFNGYIGETDVSSNLVKSICDNLYISTADFNELYGTYALLKNTHDIYLFRYQVSDYVAYEVQERWVEYSGWWIFGGWSQWEVDTNAYMFTETVNLDFDIIDVEITRASVAEIIPVVMSPVDIVPPATPPVYTTSDNAWPAWVWVLIIVVLVLVVLVILCFVSQTAPVARMIFKILGSILMAPIRGIELLFNKIQEWRASRPPKSKKAKPAPKKTATTPRRKAKTSTTSRRSSTQGQAKKQPSIGSTSSKRGYYQKRSYYQRGYKK